MEVQKANLYDQKEFEKIFSSIDNKEPDQFENCLDCGNSMESNRQLIGRSTCRKCGVKYDD